MLIFVRIFEVHRTDKSELEKQDNNVEEMCRSIAKPIKQVYLNKIWMSTAYGFILTRGTVQEFLEGVLFKEYLKSNGAVLSLNQVNTIVFQNKVKITYKDYIMALLDFTGELMRFGVSNSNSTQEPSTIKIVKTIRLILQHVNHLLFRFPKIDKIIPSFTQKNNVIRLSLLKMERTLYDQELKTRLNLHKEKLLKRRIRQMFK